MIFVKTARLAASTANRVKGRGSVALPRLTPPDVISQILLALPAWLLFEAGIVLARVLGKKKND